MPRFAFFLALAPLPLPPLCSLHSLQHLPNTPCLGMGRGLRPSCHTSFPALPSTRGRAFRHSKDLIRCKATSGLSKLASPPVMNPLAAPLEDDPRGCSALSGAGPTPNFRCKTRSFSVQLQPSCCGSTNMTPSLLGRKITKDILYISALKLTFTKPAFSVQIFCLGRCRWCHCGFVHQRRKLCSCQGWFDRRHGCLLTVEYSKVNSIHNTKRPT